MGQPPPGSQEALLASGPTTLQPNMHKHSLQQIASKLQYDPTTGILKWNARYSNCIKPSLEAGCKDHLGYLLIRVDGTLYKAHRLAWLLYYGEWPKNVIDHINGNAADNRISNLREALQRQNLRNSATRNDNTSGVKGISYHKQSGGWHARIWTDNKLTQKYFKEFDQAVSFIKTVRLEQHKEFAKG